MKKIRNKYQLMLLFMMVILASCNRNNHLENKQPSISEKQQITDSTNIKIVLKNFEYFNKHDWKNKVLLFAESTAFLDPSYGKEKVIKNREQMLQKYAGLEKAIPDIRDDVMSMYASGNTVVVEIVSHGTLPDKSDLNLPICIVYKIENGLIVEDHTYYDN